MNILSINFNHDGAGVIVSNGCIKAYVNTERFSRIKKHPGLRDEDLSELLEQAKLKLEQMDLVILCNLGTMDSPDIPLVYGSDLKETWFPFSISGNSRVLIRGLEIACIVNPDHYLLHCALAWYTSPFDSGISFCWDATGYGAYEGHGHRLSRLNLQLGFNATEVYDLAAQYVFKTGLFGAGKLMGLAPYGRGIKLSEGNYAALSDPDKLIWISESNPLIIKEGKLNLNARLAYNVQWLMEQQLSKILNELYEHCRMHNTEANLCLSGGGALNSVANQSAFKSSHFKKLFLHPACGDDGTAIGAALWYWHNEMDQPKKEYTNVERMFSIKKYDDVIDEILHKYVSLQQIAIERKDSYIDKTAALIAGGSIIGWYQGASEMGPRSLGNRSILADPRLTGMKDTLNARIKLREGFRPFAPSVLNEYAEEWFGLCDSPFMLRVSEVLKKNVPAITHADNTARIQTVRQEDNPAYYKLIRSFHGLTQVPLLLNTSFNIKSEPIVESPEHAVKSFLQSKLDHLVFPGIIVSRQATHPA